MTTTVRVPLGMEWCVGGRSTVEGDGATLRELWQDLLGRYPELMWRVSVEQGLPSFWVRILVDGRHIDQLKGLDTELLAADEVAMHIVPGSGPAAGACGPPPDVASPRPLCR